MGKSIESKPKSSSNSKRILCISTTVLKMFLEMKDTLLSVMCDVSK